MPRARCCARHRLQQVSFSKHSRANNSVSVDLNPRSDSENIYSPITSSSSGLNKSALAELVKPWFMTLTSTDSIPTCGLIHEACLGPPWLGWARLGLPGTTWDHLGPPGLGWARLGPSGPFWARLGSAGTAWDWPGGHSGPAAPHRRGFFLTDERVKVNDKKHFMLTSFAKRCFVPNNHSSGTIIDFC